MVDKTMLTVDEFMKLWGICRVTAYQLVNTEGFPTLRVGRKILIPRNQLEKWIEEHMEKGAATAQ